MQTGLSRLYARLLLTRTPTPNSSENSRRKYRGCANSCAVRELRSEKVCNNNYTQNDMVIYYYN